MNLIEQAIDEMETADQVYSHLKMWPMLDKLRAAIESLRSLQKEVEGVELPKADFFLDGGSTPCWYESSVRTAIAAALGRGAVPQTDWAADAREWGGALNDASWEFGDSYRRHMGEPTSAKLFNMCKTIIRDVILRYASKVAAAPSPEATQQAVQAEPGRRVYLVATGELHEGEETYTRHDDAPPPLCDSECLYTTPPAPGQVERDREDAENYRWLCSHMIVPSPSLWDRGVAFTTPPMPRKAGQMTKAELDDFIRAARSSDGGSND